MNQKKKTTALNPYLDRRTLLKVGGALGAVATVGPIFRTSKASAAVPVVTGQFLPDDIETADDIIYSVCQMCHSRCGLRAKVKEGVLVKIDGNPYHPNNRDVDENLDPDRLPYGTDPEVAFREIGRMCLKGQSGIQTVYDPFRIQHPLKRVGPRNSGQWETISWDQAFSEIAARIDQIIPPAFRDDLIDPNVPELGTNRNLLGFAPGRSVEKEMSERIWKEAWGTVNYGLSHTSVCESTRHVANELITWNPAGNKNSLGAGRTEGWQPDILSAELIIFFGANPLEADFPMVGMARNLMSMKRKSGTKIVVVDPRFSNTAAQAHEWVPIIPGTDAALAMGMMRSIIESSAYDAQYLSNTNQAAASSDDEPTWSDATYLVGTFTDSENKEYQRYLTAKEVGIANGTTVLDDDYVVSSSGNLLGHNQVSHGDLEFEGLVDLPGAAPPQQVVAKSSFSLLRESATAKSLSEYASICGLTASTISYLAQQFAAGGKKAVAMSYRGPIKHTNGFYNQLAIQHLNTLVGNYDWRGGCTAGGGGWGHKSGVVQLARVEGSPARAGIRIDRAKAFYNSQEAGPLFTGYPAKRPWFPFGTHGNYQEVIPSIQDEYPYAIKALITYWNAWPYSTPALRKVWEEVVSDETKLPLLVSISPVMGEVAAWADYVLPDSTYLEKFSFPGVPWRVNKGTSFQRPVVGAFDGRPIGVPVSNGGAGNTIPVNAQNDYTPVLPDTKAVLDIHIGLAKALGLPGVGANALRDQNGNPVGDLDNSWDWAKAQLQNLAQSAQTDRPGLTVEEIFSKGGVFDEPGNEYGPGPLGSGSEHLSYRYGNIIRTFVDPVARTKDSVTGDYYAGTAAYLPPTHSDGTALGDSGYDFQLITYKTVHHGQARTNVNPWLMLMIPENPIEISAQDAQSLGIETGDALRVSSPSNPEGLVGRARVTEGLRPGVIAISHHYGHWEQSSRPMVIDGAATGYDPSRGAGIQPTQIMRTDNQYPNVSLQEKIGASCSFYDTRVAIARV